MGSRTARNSEKETISGKNGARERKTGRTQEAEGGEAVRSANDIWERRRRAENRVGKNKSTGRANDVSTVRPTGAITNGILQSLRLYLPRCSDLCQPRSAPRRFQKNDRPGVSEG